MPSRRVVTVERQDNGPRVPPSFYVRPSRRSGDWIWWTEGEVPEVARQGGRFEIERIPGAGRPAWRILGPPPEAPLWSTW